MKYLSVTFSSSLSQNLTITSIYSFCNTLLRDSSKDITKSTTLELSCDLGVGEHFGKYVTCASTAGKARFSLPIKSVLTERCPLAHMWFVFGGGVGTVKASSSGFSISVPAPATKLKVPHQHLMHCSLSHDEKVHLQYY